MNIDTWLLRTPLSFSNFISICPKTNRSKEQNYSNRQDCADSDEEPQIVLTLSGPIEATVNLSRFLPHNITRLRWIIHSYLYHSIQNKVRRNNVCTFESKSNVDAATGGFDYILYLISRTTICSILYFWSWSLPSMSTACQDRAGQPARCTLVIVAVSPGDCLAVTLWGGDDQRRYTHQIY